MFFSFNHPHLPFQLTFPAASLSKAWWPDDGTQGTMSVASTGTVTEPGDEVPRVQLTFWGRSNRLWHMDTGVHSAV